MIGNVTITKHDGTKSTAILRDNLTWKSDNKDLQEYLDIYHPVQSGVALGDNGVGALMLAARDMDGVFSLENQPSELDNEAVY